MQTLDTIIRCITDVYMRSAIYMLLSPESLDCLHLVEVSGLSFDSAVLSQTWTDEVNIILIRLLERTFVLLYVKEIIDSSKLNYHPQQFYIH